MKSKAKLQNSKYELKYTVYFPLFYFCFSAHCISSISTREHTLGKYKTEVNNDKTEKSLILNNYQHPLEYVLGILTVLGY